MEETTSKRTVPLPAPVAGAWNCGRGKTITVWVATAAQTIKSRSTPEPYASTGTASVVSAISLATSTMSRFAL